VTRYFEDHRHVRYGTPGGSDSTDPSFNRQAYVRFDSLRQGRDLGLWRNLRANVEGFVGSEAGTNTVFFRVEASADPELRLLLDPINPYTDQYLQLSILGPNGQSLPLGADGRVRGGDIVNTELNESEVALKAGVYTFLITGSQWQKIPYRLLIELEVPADLKAVLIGRGRIISDLTIVRPIYLQEAIAGEGRLAAELAIDRPLYLPGGILQGAGQITGELTAEPPTGPVFARLWMTRLEQENTSTSSFLDITAQAVLAPDGDMYYAMQRVRQSGPDSDTVFISRRNPYTGVLQWQRKLGGSALSQSSRSQICIATHPSGDIIVASSGNDSSINPCYCVSRITSSGDLVWSVRPRRPNFASITVNDLAVGADGSIYVCGNTDGATAWVARHNDSDGQYTATVQTSRGTGAEWIEIISDGVLVAGDNPAFLCKLSLDLSSVIFYREYGVNSNGQPLTCRAADGTIYYCLGGYIYRLSADGSTVLDSSSVTFTTPGAVNVDDAYNCYVTQIIEAPFAQSLITRLDDSLNVVERRTFTVSDAGAAPDAYVRRPIIFENNYIATHTGASSVDGRSYFIYGIRWETGGSASVANNFGGTTSTIPASNPPSGTAPALTITSPGMTLSTATLIGYTTPLTLSAIDSYTWDYISVP
jgi:hypothetical protein